jgi:ABC-2 type transport system permease protein
MNGWIAIATMEMRAFLRSKTAVFWTFLYPVLLLGLLGAVFTTTDKGYLITGMAALTVISTALFGFTSVLIELRARGALLPLQLMPIGRMAFLTAFAASRVAILLVFALAFVLVANMAYGAGLTASPQNIAALAAMILAGSLAFLGAGLVIAAVVTKPATAQALVNIINLPIIFLSDLFIPLSVMPGWIQAVAAWSPITLFVGALRTVMQGDVLPASVAPTLAMLTIMALASFAIAATRFRWRAI